MKETRTKLKKKVLAVFARKNWGLK